jgi:hypothetical protein
VNPQIVQRAGNKSARISGKRPQIESHLREELFAAWPLMRDWHSTVTLVPKLTLLPRDARQRLGEK